MFLCVWLNLCVSVRVSCLQIWRAVGASPSDGSRAQRCRRAVLLAVCDGAVVDGCVIFVCVVVSCRINHDVVMQHVRRDTAAVAVNCSCTAVSLEPRQLLSVSS